MAKETPIKRKEEKYDHCHDPSTYFVDGTQATTYKVGGLMIGHDFSKLPVTPEEKLLSAEPETSVERAKWLLDAAAQGFVAFNFDPKQNITPKQDLEGIRDEKKVKNLDPQAENYDVPILAVQVGLVKKNIQEWINGKGCEDKVSIMFGSMIREKGGHGAGTAIDINRLQMDLKGKSTDATIQILDNLDRTICNSYKLGFPFQGDFFNPDHKIEAKKREAENKAGESEKSIQIEGALKLKEAGKFKQEANKNEKGMWVWEKESEGGNAYESLQSEPLKQKLNELRNDGIELLVFPDNDNHLHLGIGDKATMGKDAKAPQEPNIGIKDSDIGDPLRLMKLHQDGGYPPHFFPPRF